MWSSRPSPNPGNGSPAAAPVVASTIFFLQIIFLCKQSTSTTKQCFLHTNRLFFNN